MTPIDHRAALFDALTLCEQAWGKSLTQPSSDAIQAHDAARDQHHAAVEAMVRELERISAERDQSLQLAKVTTEHIERMSLDLQEAQGRAVEQCVTALLGTRDAPYTDSEARCADCDALLEEVRPGKHQHPDCPQAPNATAQPAASVEPVAWVRRHPDGALSAEFLEHAAIEDVRKRSGAWVPLYTAPVAAQAELVADRRVAAETFRRYQALHAAKGSDEGLAKARANAQLAARFEETLAGHAPAIPLLTPDHNGMRVDYSGMLKQVRGALERGNREPALAEMVRQLGGHLAELGQRWYAGDTAAVDEFLQLYCVEQDARNELAAKPSAQPQPSGDAGELPIELQGIAETTREGGGAWRSCSGCHELNEGHDTGPISKVLGCALGGGCSECGGIGAIWDTTDYDAMAALAAQTSEQAHQDAIDHARRNEGEGK